MLGVTFAANVPLNDALAAWGDPAALSADDLSRARDRFETEWNRWNLVRTVAALAVATLVAGTTARGRSPDRRRTGDRRSAALT